MNVDWKTFNFNLNYYAIGAFFAFLSGLRMPYLPEIQFILLIIVLIVDRGVKFRFILFLAMVLCTHHYVVPDYIWRFDSSGYPSIYTRAYGAIKILDLLVILLFGLSIQYWHSRNILRLFYIKGLPTILLYSSWLGILYLNKDTLAFDQTLFIIRSYLLFVAVFVLCLNLDLEKFDKLARLIVFCWIMKMSVAILIPHPHPLWRNILGINGAIFFAGDEYLTIPIYIAILILINKTINFTKIKQCIWFIFLLTMIAQRKGAIPVLLGFYLVVVFYQNKNRIGTIIIKLYYVINAILIFTFLYYVPKIFYDPLIILAFDEYTNFAHIAIDSLNKISQSDPYNFICGISPFGKYEIINLPSYMDHEMSFGKEVGEIYRYQFWSFPFGRCVLNTGVAGFIIFIIYRIKSMKYNLMYMFILISCMPVCYYYNMTPVDAFAMGISYAFIYNYQKIVKYEKDSIL